MPICDHGHDMRTDACSQCYDTDHCVDSPDCMCGCHACAQCCNGNHCGGGSDCRCGVCMEAGD